MPSINPLTPSLFASLTGSSTGSNLIAAATGTATTAGSFASVGSVAGAIELAEKNEASQLAQLARDPEVQRNLDRYARVVKEAETIDDVLDDPIARSVFLKAVGLGSQTEFPGLAKRALVSDPNDPESVASQLSGVNAVWLQVAKTYRFDILGVSSINSSDAIQAVSEDYIAERRLDQLDQQLPGLGSAILFKRLAPSLETSLQILGDPLARDVVTTALGIPKEIAGQSITAQERAIEARLDVSRLKNAVYADQLARRYLLQLNGGTSGVLA